MPIGLNWFQAFKQGNPLVGELRQPAQLVQQTHFSNNGLFRTCCCHWNGLGSLSVMSDGAKPDEIAFNFVGVLPFLVAIRTCSEGKGQLSRVECHWFEPNTVM